MIYNMWPDLQNPSQIAESILLFIMVATLKYYPDTVSNGAIDGQVYFYRWLFADQVNPCRIATETVGYWGH